MPEQFSAYEGKKLCSLRHTLNKTKIKLVYALHFFCVYFLSPANPRREKNHNSDINIEFEVLMVVEDGNDNGNTNTCTHWCIYTYV